MYVPVKYKMEITAVTKYKHGGIFKLLLRLGWTQAELARRANISHWQVSKIITLKKRPSVRQANAIQSAFGEAGQFLDVLGEWPEPSAAWASLHRRFSQIRSGQRLADGFGDQPGTGRESLYCSLSQPSISRFRMASARLSCFDMFFFQTFFQSRM